jgi:alanine racemase
VALKSKRNNAHQYVAELYEKGLRSFLVDTTFKNEDDFRDASFIKVDDTLVALQKIAVFHRQQFSIPVIGITGSNGKTIVKEWLYQCLKQDYSICRSPRSYNSQIGVPISVLNLEAHHTLAIFEAGISTRNEMDRLTEIIRPTIGIFTHLGSAHNEGFLSQEEKLQEKFKLFETANVLITRKETEGFQKHTTTVLFAEDFLDLTNALPFQDESSKINAALCAAVMAHLGYSREEIKKRLAGLQAVAMRLEIRTAIHNSLLINDFYNSDLDSLRIALNFMRQNSRRRRNCVILSDIEQSGLSSNTLYKKVQELLAQEKIDLMIGIGQDISKHKSFFPSNALFFRDAASFVAAIRSFDFQLSQSTILLKGARSAGFESISRVLQLKSHDTVFEVNLDCLRDNVNYYRTQLQTPTKLMCMVKATAYGSGSAEIARVLQNIGVNYLAVAYADEGVELRDSLIALPIMVMSPEEEAFDDIINFNLEPEIYSFDLLEKFAVKLDSYGITSDFPIHIKIDTGMRRLGFEPSEMQDLTLRLKQLPQLRVASVFSHLAAADNESLDAFTKQQIEKFSTAYTTLTDGIGYKPMRHICNSAGIARFPAAHFEMVRLGIGMYGVGVSEEEQKHLQNVGVWRSRISQIKTVVAGETVGYNRNGKVETTTQVAVVPIGYADGFSRQLGNGKHGLFVNGSFCKIIGNVCMDMCMIDVTDVECKAGDEVIVFSNNEQLQALAGALNTISYEVLTSVSGRVKRVYTQE